MLTKVHAQSSGWSDTPNIGQRAANLFKSDEIITPLHVCASTPYGHAYTVYVS